MKIDLKKVAIGLIKFLKESNVNDWYELEGVFDLVPEATNYNACVVSWNLISDRAKVTWYMISGHNGDPYDYHEKPFIVSDEFFLKIVERLTPKYKKVELERILNELVPNPLTRWGLK